MAAPFIVDWGGGFMRDWERVARPFAPVEPVPLNRTSGDLWARFADLSFLGPFARPRIMACARLSSRLGALAKWNRSFSRWRFGTLAHVYPSTAEPIHKISLVSP